MEPERLVLNLGSYTFAALTVLSMIRHALTMPGWFPAMAFGAKRSGGG